jgi:glycosyltransferase involved in cell wall biosynthesis
MAGMGIRALELARALSEEFDVRLLVPNEPAEAREVAGTLRILHAPPGSLAAAARDVGAAIVSGHAANDWFAQLPEIPVAADLYDPFPIENLHYARLLGPETAAHDHSTLERALARADFFLCASAEQRLFYAGALFANGRVGPENFPDDTALSGLLAVVPFGVPSLEARGDRAAGRAALGVPAQGPAPAPVPPVPVQVVLFGGVYDWYDPEPLLTAWPEILRRRPGAHLLFFENPNPSTTPQRVFEKTRDHARRIDPAAASIRFVPWQPYGSRADLYAAADLAVSISSEGLETELAYRTRLLDAAWGGLPSVVVAAGSLGRELAAAGAAFECGVSAGELAERVSSLLSDDDRRVRAAAAARRFAAGRTWKTVAEPLSAWCRRARVDAHRLPMPEEPKGSLLRRLFQ